MELFDNQTDVASANYTFYPYVEMYFFEYVDYRREFLLEFMKESFVEIAAQV